MISPDLPTPQPRCFYCDAVLPVEQARILLPAGKVYGPCCFDIAEYLIRTYNLTTTTLTDERN